jgi:hypothetical protein
MFLPPAGKLQQQTSLVADACTTTTGLIFITDRTSKHRFLIDTGSDLWVFPRKLVAGRKERANGTTIPTYGWISLSLNMGLRRDFTWRFVVAEVQTPTSAWTYSPTSVSSSTAGTPVSSTQPHRCLHRPEPHTCLSPERKP